MREERPSAPLPSTASTHKDNVNKCTKTITAPETGPEALIAHLQSPGGQYRPHVAVTIRNVRQKGMVDSGNTWRNAISEKFLEEMGLSLEDVQPLPGVSSVKTAGKGQSLEVLGELKSPVRIQLGGHRRTFKDKPAVIRNLEMPLNISGPFLKHHGIDQCHSQDALKVDGKLVPLLGTDTGKPAVSNLYLTRDCVVPPQRMTMIPVVAPQLQHLSQPQGDYVVSGDERLKQHDRLMPWSHAITSSDSRGQLQVAVVNVSREPITIRKGTRYGQAEPYVPLPPGESKEDYIAGMTASQAPTDPETAWMRGPTMGQNRKQRVEHLVKVFELEECQYLSDPKAMAKAVLLLLRYWELFAWHNEAGYTTLMEHKIELSQEEPINVRHRPVNPALVDSLDDQVAEWLQEGVVEPAQSPFNFPLLPVKKKNGEYRWVQDFRKLNAVTIKDSFPIGEVEANLSHLANSKIFSIMDGCSGFYSVPLRDEDKHKTAFSTRSGQYQWTRMSMGMTNAPSTYARLMQLVLAGIPPSVTLSFLDDVLVHSRTLEQHFEDLARVLEAHKRAGIKLKPTKCHFFREKLEYLGHEISSEGTSPMPSYVDKVVSWPIPTTRKAVRCFLGLTNYYRRYIQGYSQIAAPLTEKLKQDGTSDTASFEPTMAFKAAFDGLKRALTTAPIFSFEVITNGFYFSSFLLLSEHEIYDLS